MNARNAAPAILDAIRAADRHGIAIPADVRGALEAATASVAAAHQLAPPDLAGLVADAIAAGRDPVKEKAVRDAAVSHHVLTACGPNAIREKLEERAAAVAKDNAAAVIEAFKPRYAELGRLLAEDHATLTAAGVEDLDDARLSMRAGTQAARAHARAFETITALAALDRALVPLRALANVDGSPVDIVVRNVDAPGASAAELRGFGAMGHWEIVARGWTLDLATPAEAKERHKRAYEVQATHDRAAKAAGTDAIRSRYGAGRPITV